MNEPAPAGGGVRDSNRNWLNIASSSDGVKLAAVVYDGQIYTFSGASTCVSHQQSLENVATR
jgi:hypothetical protein